MKLLKVSFLSLFVLVSLVLVNPVFATVASTAKTISPKQSIDSVSKATIISGVNVYESKIISQDKNNINISFNIVNQDQAQSGLKYGIQLVKKTPTGQFIADEYVSSESIILSPKEVLKKTVEYIAPRNLSGDYTIFIYVKNENGLTLGLGTAGKVTLASTLKMVEILPETCFLSVGENSKEKYSLRQGVDILKTENLKLTCTSINHADSSITATPSYETHYRTIYGKIVNTEGGSSDVVTFKPGENKILTLTLPKATSPQAYDVKVFFKNNGLNTNSVNVHYVLRGASATIQTFSLDKNSYNTGDTAKMNFSWSPSADSFPGSRYGAGSALSPVSLNISIVNNEGEDCISPINQVLATDNYNIDFSPNIKTECKNLKATILLKDEKGTILDQRVLSFELKSDLVKTSYWNIKNILIILGILIVAGFALYFINLKKKQNEKNVQ